MIWEYLSVADQEISKPRGAVWGLGTVLMPTNTPYAFIVRVENKMHVVHIACLLQLFKVYAFYAVIIYKYFQTGGGGGGAPVLDPPLMVGSPALDLFYMYNNPCVNVCPYI